MTLVALLYNDHKSEHIPKDLSLTQAWQRATIQLFCSNAWRVEAAPSYVLSPHTSRTTGETEWTGSEMRILHPSGRNGWNQVAVRSQLLAGARACASRWSNSWLLKTYSHRSRGKSASESSGWGTGFCAHGNQWYSFGLVKLFGLPVEGRGFGVGVHRRRVSSQARTTVEFLDWHHRTNYTIIMELIFWTLRNILPHFVHVYTKGLISKSK